MKKLIAPLLTVALLAACSNDAGNTTTTPDMAPAPDTTAATTGNAPAVASTAGATAPAAGNAAGTAATATGTVESVDPEGGRIVIAHGPVESLNWPSMTMGFKATPEQVQAVQPGQKVTFDFDSQGANNTITRIEPAQ
jgi:Cu(I)/Ag(I) efflux system protein CusF